MPIYELQASQNSTYDWITHYVFSLCAAFLRYDYIIIDYGTQIVHVIAFNLRLNYTQDLQCL